MNKVFFSGLGMGIIFDSMQELEENVTPVELNFQNGSIHPDTMTDVFGFWKQPIMYKGLLKNDKHNCMVFYLGSESDFFTNRFFCDVIYWITETRMFKKYNELSGRDYNLIEGIWK